ncbi:formimidoylglutamate deiminase [Ornithinimicrobium ciconiae]|nr:formimidoylglutamate deiminase [Ornithinimicrobium ciconiae]
MTADPDVTGVHERSRVTGSAPRSSARDGSAGRTRVLLTGMSGVGKSTLVHLLRDRGLAAVDLDEGYTTESIGLPGEVLWLEDRVAQLLDGPEDVLFVAGCASNQVGFHADFDHIVLLSAPPEVIAQRLRVRDTNPFGKSPQEEAQVMADLGEVEPLLRAVADHEVVTVGSPADAVAQLLSAVSADREGLGPSHGDDGRERARQNLSKNAQETIKTSPKIGGEGERKWHAEWALLPDGLARDVLFVVDGGRFVAVTPGVPSAQAASDGAERLPGVVLPGLANCHSHAFHRALRGRTHHGGGTFWTWREGMYAVANRLDPDSYLALARVTYAEMALAGITAVGEFHYLHHGPDGTPYEDPNAMGLALVEAARDAGIRLTLLDTLYLAGGLTADGHTPLEGPQRRFGDRDVAAWAQRVSGLRVHTSGGPAHLRLGGAIHSVRAVPRDQLALAPDCGVADGMDPLHIHLSEQPAENEATLAAHGLTPTQLLAEEGVLAPNLTAVHATHLTGTDIGLLAAAHTTACFCPTTERDLADGIGPARALADAGVRLSLGSDQHAVIDLIEEARALEMHERLHSLQRGRFTPEQLLTAATAHATIGWQDAGRLEVGARADLVAVRLDSPRTAGSDPGQILLTASAADVDTVVVDGHQVVSEGRHRLEGTSRLGTQLTAVLNPLWDSLPPTRNTAGD